MLSVSIKKYWDIEGNLKLKHMHHYQFRVIDVNYSHPGQFFLLPISIDAGAG
jgi:hypothetical protein